MSAQKPIEGVSLLYSFDDPKAKGRRGTQYFEMFGNRAVYHDGWVAVCSPRPTAVANRGTIDFDDYTWQLYNVDDDFSESNDLAAKKPQAAQLQDIFRAEAAKYNVLPLDDRLVERGDPTPAEPDRRSDPIHLLRRRAERPESSSPNVKNHSHSITATSSLRGDGVLVAAGGTVGGYTLFVKDRSRSTSTTTSPQHYAR